MSVFKVLENKINNEVEYFSEYTDDWTGDKLAGIEFMFFALAKVFSNKSPEEIESGIVDSLYRREKYDFGIDAIYITASKELVENEEQLENFSKDAKFVIHIFQFKKGQGIKQADLLKFKKGINKALIDEDLDSDDNLYFYNRMINLNNIKEKLYNEFPSENIKVICHIAFSGLKNNVIENELLAEELENIKSELQKNGFTNNEINVLDSQELIKSSSEHEDVTDIIEYKQTLKYITESTETDKLNGYISIVKGDQIAALVKKHQSSLFEANIRDYYKRSGLNNKITKTSSSNSEAKFFWSFNNGLTVTCKKVDELPNDKYRLHNLQIVNGCQTSNAIYDALKNKERVCELTERLEKNENLTKKEIEELETKKKKQLNDNTTLLVKIIETNNENLIYRITETTNSQTPIKVFSLKANDDIQFLIEEFMKTNGIWYERRINYYRNQNKKNIVNIQKLFQLYTSQITFKPSQVKTRPKSMFISDYEKVFPAPSVKLINYLLYLIPVKVEFALNKKIRDVRRKKAITDMYQNTILSYGKLHLGCFVLSSILKEKYNEKNIVAKSKYILSELENNIDIHFDDALNNFENILKKLIGNRKESIITGVRKNALDERIVKFIKNRK